MPSTDYLLGHSSTEWDRLNKQHALWRDTLIAHFPELNGQRVLELGCGNGSLLSELSEMVDPFGSVSAVERDPSAAASATTLAPDADIHVGDLMNHPLGGPYDLIVSRWVFSFLSNPAEAIRRAAAHLAPGGRLVIQDYNHDGVRIFPDVPAFNRTIQAYRAAYRESGGDLWVGAALPRLLKEAGLRVEAIDPQVKAGHPGSPTWAWVERFVFEHLDSITASAHHPPGPARLSTEEIADLKDQWAAARADPGALLFSPIQVCVVGSKP